MIYVYYNNYRYTYILIYYIITMKSKHPNSLQKPLYPSLCTRANFKEAIEMQQTEIKHGTG